MKTSTILFLALLIAGCVDISTDLQPVNPSVNPVLMGEDCVQIILGFGFGHNTVEGAQKNVHPVDKSRYMTYANVSPITKIRVITLYESYGLVGGERCLQVVGEP
jgi:hypothetical protein